MESSAFRGIKKSVNSLSTALLPTGFDRLSADVNNEDLDDGNHDPTSLEVGKKNNQNL